MSYILEALRRAERERAQGQGVAVTEAGNEAVAASSRRGPLMTAIVALLAINALVISVLLMRDKPEAAAVQLTVDVPASSPGTMPATTPAPAMQPVAASDDAVVEQGVASMDDLGAAGESDEVAPAPQTVVAAPAPRGRVTFAKKPLTDVKPQRSQPEIEDDLVEEPTPAEAGSAPTVEPAPNASAAASSIKPLSDMSAAYQAAFPQLVMEVHVYDAQPQRRFATIGGQRYHEGDSLPQGARLVGIVPEGLVVDFRNETVLYPIGRH